MNNGIHTNSNYSLPGVSGIQTGMGREVGAKTSTATFIGRSATPQAFTPKVKAQILDSLAKVTGESFAAYCINLFCKNAHLKTDYEVRQMIKELQSQAEDNKEIMRRVLGDQFDFLMCLRFRPDHQ
jgi:hypothetical protein